MMSFRRVLVVAAVGAAIIAPVAAQRDNPAQMSLEAARQTETLQGDLSGAIKQYQSIVDKYSKTDRAVVAQALVAMAECYQKLGSVEARKVYERIVREYADQKEAITIAQARLGSGSTRDDAVVNRQIWKSSAEAVSGDGGWLSYVAEGDVFIHNVISKTNRRLTDRSSRPRPGEYAETSAIARDGQQIAYSWSIGPRYQLRVIGTNGRQASTPRILLDNPEVTFVYPLDWSPDGQTIAVGLGRADRSSQIALVASKDGKLQILKSIDWRGPIKAMFSPDGKFLAFDLPVDAGPSNRDVFVLSSDANREAHVIDHPANDLLAGWSPDGRFLLFVSNRSGSTALWAVSMAAGRPSGTPTMLRSDLGAFVASVGTTRTGAFLYVQRTQAVKVYAAAVDFTTGKITTPGAPVLETYLQGQRGPVWSADGNQLAWTSPSPLGSGQRGVGATIHSLVTGRTSEIASELSAGSLRGWAPDGSLVYHGSDLKGRFGIFRVDVSNGGATAIAIADEGFLTLPSWSADGRTLAYRHQIVGGPTGRAALAIRDMRTGTTRELLNSESFGYFAMSPDGKTIAYAQPMQSPRSLRLLDLASGTTHEILSLPSGETIAGVQWLPDSQRLVLWKSVAEKSSGSVVSMTGQTLVQLEPTIPQDFRVHPDGRRIAYSAGNAIREVWALENFLPGAQIKR